MKITFCGAAGCVTGSNYFVQTEKYNFIVDCGLFQGSKSLKENNYKNFIYDPASVNFALVTHAHIDHTGLLPKLVKHGFKGPIYATEPTVDLLHYLLLDSAHIQEIEVMQKNRRNERKGLPPISPMYEQADAEAAIALLKGVKKYQEFSPAPGCTVKYYNAGHVLGSSFIEIVIEENGEKRKLVFSGDLGEKDHPIVHDPDSFKEADFLLVESTYGTRLREEVTKEERLNKLAEVFKRAVARGGNIIIPAFALERTQDLLHDILILKERGDIPKIPVVVDSPLAVNITKVFVKYPECYDEDAQEILKKMGNLFDHPDFRFTESSDESKMLNQEKGICIMSASGMCDAGRIKHHLKHNLWKPENTVIFVGYQAEGTLGRLILQGAKTVRIHGEEVSVEAAIEQVNGYSGHADQNGLIEWIDGIEKIHGNVFVIHGEPESAEGFAELIVKRKGFKAIVPKMGETFDLLELVKVEKAEQIKPVAVVQSVPASVGPDSHNLYATLMLKLADFMRNTPDEEKRRAKLNELLSAL
ncbi:MAG: MBL fold metallo-hydrolase [Candidatus Rifleibacteriota bacterium]